MQGKVIDLVKEKNLEFYDESIGNLISQNVDLVTTVQCLESKKDKDR
ncbi:TMH-family membrane domain protein [Chlamydia psittaci GR9]|nr:TMH-family membrane domain protein [Chlamydia psittaci GR9]AFS23456.1 TMH-family membrane domain protein [Chlamydia psittaci WS/RT/E30]